MIIASCSSGPRSQEILVMIVPGENGEPCIKNKEGQILVTTGNGKYFVKYYIVQNKKSMLHNKLYLNFFF